MGNHRADHRAPRRRSAPRAASRDRYVGKRVAGREAQAPPVEQAVEPVVARRVEPVETSRVDRSRVVRAEDRAEVMRSVTRTPTVELPALRDIPLVDPLTDSTTALRAVQPGRRRAVRHAGSRGPLFRGLPSLPVAVGVTTLAIAVGGVLTSPGDPQLAAGTERLVAANALTGSFGTASFGTRGETVSRDSDRDALAQATGSDVVAEAERHAEERNSALGALARDAEKEAGKIALNQWVVPIEPGAYRLTATFGQYGLWSSYHTGLDFAAPSGTPIRAIANGVVTEVGSDGAYGNKTVLTLEDGTEIWFCHQTSFAVEEGDTVRSGEVIGYVGSTGNSTGPHLHLEVRPGGGDPLDPYAALRAHGVDP
ncbi:M23 family metallopeptidase [Nocardioides sp. SYSU DS0651]|uniref:M23 family metallopeptidase n=1 Tax=Nocardioides sp. SYSU DS0651 TaxID=3415955 RepID=UPI003F4B26A0